MQISSGSPSPSRRRPVLSEEKAATSSPQNVCGIKPYSAGQILEYFCGRSTLRYPEILSISYFSVSDGTTSTKHCTVSGTWSPGEIPCHGCGLNRTPRSFHNGCVL